MLAYVLAHNESDASRQTVKRRLQQPLTPSSVTTAQLLTKSRGRPYPEDPTSPDPLLCRAPEYRQRSRRPATQPHHRP